jgi:hypothetical protein
MSMCPTCGGAGTVPCPTCHGQGFTSRTTPDGETVNRLCPACQGKRKAACTACHGTGQAAPAPAQPAPAPAAAHPHAPSPDRLAGRWNGHEGTWYEFVPNGGPNYRVSAGGPLGTSATGTAKLVGHTITIDATDKLLGHYTLELMLRGNYFDGIDRKAGFPLPVTFHRATQSPPH